MKATKMIIAVVLALIMLTTIAVSADTGCEAVDTSLNKRPEVTDLTYTVRGMTVYFRAIAKDDEFSSGFKEWIWDFGDGNIENKYGGWRKINETRDNDGTRYYFYEMEVSHTYKDYRQYTVKLTVKDRFGETHVYTASITVTKSNYPPLVEIEDVYPNPAKPGEKVTFIAGATDPDGRVSTFYWDFGDGSKQQGANLTKLSHTYSREGVYTVTVKVADDKGLISNEASVKVYVRSETVTAKLPNRAPVITRVTFTPNEADPGTTITFKASAYDPDGDSFSYIWDFGDGVVKEGNAEVTHAYSKEGAYTVKVKARDSKGLESPYYTVSVAIKGNKPPQASVISVKSLDGVTFVFQGMGIDPDGRVVAYEWDMGDGKVLRGELEGNSIPHKYLNYTYSRSGNYTVAFRVRDDKGAWSNWVREKIEVKLPEKIASAAVSLLGFDNIWIAAGVGGAVVLLASYLAVRDSSKGNGFLERANSSKKVVVKRNQVRREVKPPRYQYRDYRSFARRGSKRAPWD